MLRATKADWLVLVCNSVLVFKTQAADDSTERLRKLKKLLDEQLITEEEYEKKKNEILSQL